jgi:hypothetical protein
VHQQLLTALRHTRDTQQHDKAVIKASKAATAAATAATAAANAFTNTIISTNTTNIGWATTTTTTTTTALATAPELSAPFYNEELQRVRKLSCVLPCVVPSDPVLTPDHV